MTLGDIMDEPQKLTSINQAINKAAEKAWIKVGEYTVSEFIDNKNQPCLWIENKDGEAVGVDIEQLWRETF